MYRIRREKRIVLVFGMLLSYSAIFSQHQELNEDPKLWRKSPVVKDSNYLLHRFQTGNFHGHIRSFFSSQFNQQSEPEYAQAIGGGIQFKTQPIQHLSAGVSGFFVFNAFSSDLTQPHPLSKTYNRYELGLFDITDPANTNDLDRLEELFVEYKKKR